MCVCACVCVCVCVCVFRRATNPSQFEIEFFVNDLSKRGAGTFESVGCLQYNQQGRIHMDFEKKVCAYVCVCVCIIVCVCVCVCVFWCIYIILHTTQMTIYI